MHSGNFPAVRSMDAGALILAFKVKSGPEETGLIIVKSAIKTASSWDTDVSQGVS